MHPIQRLVPGLLGLALAVPLSAAAVAHEPDAPASQHQHKGLMGWKHCVDCQRARALSRDGVNVPPPPSAVPQGAVIEHVGHDGHDGHFHAEGVIIEEGPIVLEGAYPPGQAVVGGEPTYAAAPAGRAVVGGADPTPVGVSRAAAGNFTPVGNVASNALRDPSITPTSIPPAQTAIGGSVGSRPRIISHLLGLPDLRRLRRERQAYQSREGHASISYGDGINPVTDLPASMVYGDEGR